MGKVAWHKVGDIFPNWKLLEPITHDSDARSDQFEMKEWDLFVVLNDRSFSSWDPGTIVSLKEDDDSTNPYFFYNNDKWDYEAIDLVDIARLPVTRGKKGSVNYSYEVSYTRKPDMTTFKKDMINGQTVKFWEDKEKTLTEEARKIRGWLNSHSKLKF